MVVLGLESMARGRTATEGEVEDSAAFLVLVMEKVAVQAQSSSIFHSYVLLAIVTAYCLVFSHHLLASQLGSQGLHLPLILLGALLAERESALPSFSRQLQEAQARLQSP